MNNNHLRFASIKITLVLVFLLIVTLLITIPQCHRVNADEISISDADDSFFEQLNKNTNYQDLKFRTQKLKKYVDMIARKMEIGSAQATRIEIWDNAPEIFSHPAANGVDSTPQQVIATTNASESGETQEGSSSGSSLWEMKTIGAEWGSKQGWTYFRGEITIPSQWDLDNVWLMLSHDAVYIDSPVDDNFPAGPEGQVFINRKRAAAIDQFHKEIKSSSLLRAGRNTVSGVFFAGRCRVKHKLSKFEAVLRDPLVYKLYRDLQVAIELIQELSESSPVKYKYYEAVDSAIKALDFADDTRFYRSVEIAGKVFDAHLKRIKHNLEAPEVVAVGHAHIDLAWLWPISQTKHKCVRTFATQTHLLESTPESKWTFFQSTPQFYEWIEEYAPDLFEKIVALVKKGRWEAEGAMWVESDTNLAGGESLVRQLLYGKRYFKQKLNVTSTVLWLPDVFGYTASLPQLLRLAGVDTFVTSKISWSQYNRFPLDTFNWQGIDGSTVVTHFITTPPFWGDEHVYYTYNSLMHVKEVKGVWDKYKQKPLFTEPLLTFGFGDGGGGPTEEMVNFAERLSEWPTGDLPRLKLDTVKALAQRLQAKKSFLPTWVGELYLEYHRGTYTSQAQLKRMHRFNEINLHNLEWFFAIAATFFGYRNITEEQIIKQMWKGMLVTEFHDILPGSSVGEVYEEVIPMQQKIHDESHRLIMKIAQYLLQRMEGRSSLLDPLCIFNTLSFDRKEIVEIPLKDGSSGQGKLVSVVVPANGWLLLDGSKILEGDECPKESGAASELRIQQLEGGDVLLENAYVSVRFDSNGTISYMYDKLHHRNILKEGQLGNEFLLFDDRPMEYDAWNIDAYYKEHRLPGPKVTSTTIHNESSQTSSCRSSNGRMRVGFTRQFSFPHHYGASDKQPTTITQTVYLYNDSALLEFDTSADWHLQNKLLKVSFPFKVHTTEATSEVQFGNYRRSTHSNTAWDVARFETTMHRFVDVSEYGYGVAILNDCKYGHSTQGSTIQITLIKSATAPHAQADQGKHEFRYAVLPHRGSLEQGGVVERAAAFNNKLIVVRPTVAHRMNNEDHDCHGQRRQEASAEMQANPSVYTAHGSGDDVTWATVVKPKKEEPKNEYHFDGTAPPASFQFMQCSPVGVVVETIKLPEANFTTTSTNLDNANAFNTTNDVIVRIYEAYGGSRNVKCSFPFQSPESVVLVNLLEEETELDKDSIKLQLSLANQGTNNNNNNKKKKDQALSFALKPFQIITLRMTFSSHTTN